MRKSKVFSLFFIGLLLGTVILSTTSYGCWFPISELEPAYYGTDSLSFMEFGIYNDPILRPWHYYPISSGKGPLSRIDTSAEDPLSAANLSEWREYCQNQPSLKDIAQVIYDSKNLAQLKALQRRLTANPSAVTVLRDGERQNSMLKWLITHKDIAALDYIIYAKQCEPLATAVSPWEDVEAQKPANQVVGENLYTLGMEQYQRARSPFLKVRYAYQVIRLDHYTDDFEACVKDYDQLVPNINTNSHIKYRALLHKAGALKALEQDAQALVLTSLVIDQCPAMMEKAFRDFQNPNEQLWQDCYRLLKSNHQKATFWMLRGLREERIILEPLEQMFQLEPQSPRLEMMLIRQVNRLEELGLHTGNFFAGTPLPTTAEKEPTDYRKYISDLKKFVLTAVANRKVRQPALWYLTAGYLSLMEQNWAETERYLQLAGQSHSTNPDLNAQITLVKNLALLAKTSQLTPQLEAAIFPSLKWAAGLNREYNNQTIYRSLLILLGQKYLHQNQLAKGALCFAKAGYYYSAGALLDFSASKTDLDQLLALYANPKTSLEKFLSAHNRYVDAEKLSAFTRDDFYYIQGTKLMRQGKFNAAYQSYRQISGSFWKQAKGKNADYGVITAFNADYWNSGDSIADTLPQKPAVAPLSQLRYYTKLDFVKKVLELEAAAVKDPQHADRYYLQIANGFFHSPYWGYNDIIWAGTLVKSIRDTDYQQYPFNFGDFAARMNQKLGVFLGEYGTRQIAINYYRKAAQATRDPELGAQCLWLACEAQTPFSPLNRDQGTDDTQLEQEFTRLKQHYRSTRFMKQTIEECTTLKDFMNQK